MPIAEWVNIFNSSFGNFEANDFRPLFAISDVPSSTVRDSATLHQFVLVVVVGGTVDGLDSFRSSLVLGGTRSTTVTGLPVRRL